ncbi:MAG TPA: MscL family protein [Solirubrobacterales bacterium]
MGEPKTSPMIKAYSKSLREFIARGDAIVVAAAFLIALGTFYFLQTLMEGLVAPALAALFDEPDIYALHFTINGSAFRYGEVLVGLILLALAFVVVAVVGKFSQGAESSSTRDSR